AYPTWVVIKETGGHDLVVVVRRVGETAFTVAIAQGPDAGHVGPQLIVDDNVAARVRLYPSVLQAQVIGVRPPTHRKQQMAAHNLAVAFLAIGLHCNPLAMRFEAYAFCVEPQADSLPLHDLPDGSRHVGVFTPNQLRAPLHDGHLASEAAKHLAEFEPDVT